MKLTHLTFLTFLILIVFPFNKVFSTTSPISFVPNTPIQGEPVMIIVENTKLSDIKTATFQGKILKLFLYKNKPTALLGIDIKRKPGNYEIAVLLKNGRKLNRPLEIKERKKLEEVFSIPEKLGGDTLASQQALVTSLTLENSVLNNISTAPKTFWSDRFTPPLEDVVVTDPFGYSRKTGQYILTHKGTDLRAKEGTKVFAMNDGVVRVTSEGRNYGKTIVIDHGLGVMTFYLHLSKINVKDGELVKKGQFIALSGQTGYAAAPHLHLSVRIYNVSVDPMKFMELFN